VTARSSKNHNLEFRLLSVYSRLLATKLNCLVLVLLATILLAVIHSQRLPLLHILLPPLVRDDDEFGFWGLGKRHLSKTRVNRH